MKLIMYLDTLGQGLELFSRELNRGCALGDEGHDGDTGMATNNGAVHVSGIKTLLLG